MKAHLIVISIGLLTFTVFAGEGDHRSLRENAERLYAEGSYARANELYRQAAEGEGLPASEARWIRFRIADTAWRSHAATQSSDPTAADQARQELESLLRELDPGEKPQVWAEAQESLADFHWTRRDQSNWHQARPFYETALDWWAGARDINLARERYLAIVWRMARPPFAEPYMRYGNWGNYVPARILENAAKIAQTDSDRAHARYLLALTLSQQGTRDPEQRARVAEEFEGALTGGKANPWYDDALYQYAEWLTMHGRAIPMQNGTWRYEADYAKALELFRRLTNEFRRGETRYYDQAEQQIQSITAPQIAVSVSHIFLPDSEIQYQLNWRNVEQVSLTIYPADLNRDVRLSRDPQNRWNWLDSIEISGRERLRSWSFTPTARDGRPAGDDNVRDPHRPGSRTFRLEEKLPPGAYVLEAGAGTNRSRELILVTDAALVLKTSGRQALAYMCNAIDSSPIPNAEVKLWHRWHDGNRWQVSEQTKRAGEDGIALFDVNTRDQSHGEFFASARAGSRQAFSPGDGSRYGYQNDPWKVYATTDRPAYRPGETVNWKFTARRYNGSVYSTPSDQRVEYEITDPRGAKVSSDSVTLNAFGSAWGTLELTNQLPLGEYQVSFWAGSGRRIQIGSATLFRLEEYKLPEFRVTVQTPEENGRKKAFRLGEEVEVAIQSDYYFGGPVANATVEVVIYQDPLWRLWPKPREFPWFYQDMDSGEGRHRRWLGGGGQIVKRETLRADATGKATVRFETPRNQSQDYEYRVEARVTDSSRREIIGNGTVRVTRQRYDVHAAADHNLYRPQDRVGVEFRALDANDQPVEAEGTVRVTREFWYEIWTAPDGREVRGDELKRLQAQSRIWPPVPERPDQRDWQLRFRGYERDEILTRPLRTGTNGIGEFTFTPEREGYYRVAWTSQDVSLESRFPVPQTIRAETTVWVATTASTDLGYRSGAVEIIADKDTFRVGQRAPIMLVTSTSDRYVLFSVEGEDLHSYQLVHMTGPVKLVELPIEEQHVPNIFLSATLVHDRQMHTDTKQVVVPPTRNFLTVEVTSDRPEYQPREQARFEVTTRNHEGEPVSAEVSFALVDDSVYYIQSDYAADPREFFFGTKRSQQIQTRSTMNQKKYSRLVPWEGDRLIDERDKEQLERSRRANEMGNEEGRIDTRPGDRWYAESMIQTASAMMADGDVASFGVAASGGTMPGAAQRMRGAADLGKLSIAGEVAPGAATSAAVLVRSDFRSTVAWQPGVVTDQSGRATLNVTYPDSLTTWRATARAATRENQFGFSSTNARTRQPLIVRLQAPRFFVVGDTVTLSAVVNNNTDQALDARVVLETAGFAAITTNAASVPILGNLSWFSGGTLRSGVPTVQVPANGEARVDWTARLENAGTFKLKVTARAGDLSDAMERSYAAHEHGIEKFLARSGKARANDFTVNLDLPAERKVGSTSMTVQVTPSMAVTMLDALPYLLDYPYGCTEQTMSRFLPAAITAKTLRELGLEPGSIMGRVFGGIETNTAAATHPRGQTHLDELDKLVNAGLDRLYDFQHSDGGWGWWKEGDSDHWMTAYVVWGMSLARDAGIRIDTTRLSRAGEFLDKKLVEQEESPDMQAWMLHALAVYNAADRSRQISEFSEKAFQNLWTRRDQLNAYTRALLALSAHHFGKTDQAKILVQNLENGVKRDTRPDTSILIRPDASQPAADTVQQTAHWGEDRFFWRWSEGGVESTAFALRALLAIDPQNPLIEPVSNWLIKNRRGAQWSNTRDTAIVVLAMNDYLRASGELQTDLQFEVLVNGQSIATHHVRGADVFNAPSRFAIDPHLIRDRNEVRIRSTGNGSIYFAVESTFFSLEEPVAPAGNEIFVKRDYYKLVGRPTLLKGYVYDREPLRDGDAVKSGERVQTVLTIEAKNNYEYLVFEDLKPAGLEAVAIRSGESLNARELKSGAVERVLSSPAAAANRAAPGAAMQILPRRPPPGHDPSNDDFTGRTQWVYQELRDRKVAMFVDKLPEGVWQIQYDLRAEVPGRFHALPVVGHAMYVPEIRANGAEVRIVVEDPPGSNP